MADTNLDYEKMNKFLPESLRNFVGATNRISRQNFQEFISMYSGIELLAILNNIYAAEYASGYSQFNLMYMRSGVPSKLLEILVSKTVGNVKYQVNGDEKKLNEKFDSFYFTLMLHKAFEQSAATGRGVMAVYGDFDNEEAHLECYNLFRSKLIFGKKNEVKESSFYINRIDGAVAGYEYIVEEHRYYKERKLEDGTKEYIPMQEFVVNKSIYEKEDKSNSKVSRLELVPDEIQNKYPNIKFNQPRELKGFNSIGVFYIDFTPVNKKFPDLRIPEAMFVDAVDNALMLETSITDREVEKEVGRGQILMPEFGDAGINTYQTQANVGTSVMRTVSTHYKNPIFQKYPSMRMEDSKPQSVQFDIRAEQWETSIKGDIERLCSSVGIGVIDYMPSLLGGTQRTDDEINALTDMTANTVTKLRTLNTYQINKCLECVGLLLKVPTPISIRWSMASIINPTKNADLIIKELQNGLISRKEAIKRVNPDLNDTEIEELYKSVQNEVAAQDINTAFSGF